VQNGRECLIATAAFGSELNTEVQFLRNFRDGYIMKTVSGASFMSAFNAWYYSFSPYVADYERSNSIAKESIKYAIYPLIGILHLSENGFHTSGNQELSAIFSGFVASSMIGAVYLTPLTYSIRHIRTKKPVHRIFVAVFGSILVALLLAISSGNESVLMIATSAFVLSTVVSISIYAAHYINSLHGWLRSIASTQ
jgi:peptide/nickel transport system substrate-binding protein